MKNVYFARILLSITIINMLTSPVMAQTPPKMSGFMKVTGSGSEGEPSAMTVTNVRVRVSGDIDDRTSYTFFVDMVRDDVLLDAAISFVVFPTVVVTAGQFKSPYSTDNLMAATVYPFINRGYLKSKVTPSFRDIGVKVTLKKRNLELTAAVLNGAGANKAETNTGKNTICRAVVKVSSWMSISGNYSHGVSSTDGSDMNFYDTGINGSYRAVTYAGEYACKCQNSKTEHVCAVWLSYDCVTGYNCIPMLTPAVKCEVYDSDQESQAAVVTKYTIGLSTFLSETDGNCISMNYAHEMTDRETIMKSIALEYEVKFD